MYLYIFALYFICYIMLNTCSNRTPFASLPRSYKFFSVSEPQHQDLEQLLRRIYALFGDFVLK